MTTPSTTTISGAADAEKRGQTAAAPDARGIVGKGRKGGAGAIIDAGGAVHPSALPPLPDPPRKKDMLQSLNFVLAGIMHIIGCYYQALRYDDRILVAGEGYVCATRREALTAPHPDLLIAFDVNAAAIAPSNGYVIEEVGKPPDFVLEVASRYTERRDYTDKRVIYAGLGIAEYWRFDHTGGQLYDAPLAGDRLVGDAYVRIPTERDGRGRIWGYSAALGLWLCWDGGRLRFHDGEGFLEDLAELSAARDEERAARRSAEVQRDGERTARLTAEVQRDGERTARLTAEVQRDGERTARLTAEVQRDGARDERDAARQELGVARQELDATRQERDALLAELRRLRDAGQ